MSNPRQKGSMKYWIICPWLFLLLLVNPAWSATDNLDEMTTRKSRQVTATWGTSYLENPLKNYTWQPESLCYKDIDTNAEVWVIVRAPDRSDIYSKEHGTNAWSYDGSRIGFFTTSRSTNNPAVGSEYNWRWIVNSDGSGLKACEGYGRRDFPFEGFNWAHNGNYYYSFGSGSGEGSNSYSLYKNTVGANNQITGSLLLDTSSINTYKKEIVKEGVGSNDTWIVARDLVTHNAGRDCVRTTREMYFIQLGAIPRVVSHWGIARGIGPSADPYGNHVATSEERFHDVWAPGPYGDWVMGTYSGSAIFVAFQRTGSSSDGGPRWQNWDGNSFGTDEIKVVSNGDGTPNNPYGTPYFGHPVFDRWGKYALIGTYTDNPRPGTRIWDAESNTLLPNYVLAYNQYDGQHHSWTGWTEYVVGIDPGNMNIYINKWNQNYTSAKRVAKTNHPGYTGNYNGYPRPSQSPDGTKIAFAACWLNNSGDDYPYISYAVAYYPHPPKISGAVKSGSYVRLSWGWDNQSKYTTRGWPNEGVDAAPNPREIKAYHVWASQDTSNWTEITTTGVSYGTNYLDISQPYGSTWYYAVTSEEHSRLESRTLSNVWRVTLDESGNITGSTQQRPYPADPGGISQFYTRTPLSPSNFNVTKQPTQGHYLLTWTEPQDTKIRYYNIYYSTTGIPPAAQRYRIASVPVGTSRYLDWCADPSANAYYRITSVDRQGNESNTSSDVQPPAAPSGISATIAD